MLLMRVIAALVIGGIACAQAVKTPIPFQCVAEELDNAGLTCTTAHPCPVYVELASLEVVGSKLFLAGNFHTSDTTVASILLASEDGGRTWTEPFKRLPGAGLEHIQFVDYEFGWIGGQHLQGRPKDAFLLITRDGGKTWQPKPLFEEARVGAIQQFWFEDRNRGSLLIDRIHSSENGSRHELYESQTGGETWTLLEVSQRPIAIKRSRAQVPNTDWRLRPDAPSKTYHVEQKQGERWRTVATFPIHVADCRTAEVTLADPPVEQPQPEPVKPAEPAAPRKPPTLKKKN
jgi:photosystem II stability/assembly factor-like uncharacterized protein